MFLAIIMELRPLWGLLGVESVVIIFGQAFIVLFMGAYMVAGTFDAIRKKNPLHEVRFGFKSRKNFHFIYILILGWYCWLRYSRSTTERPTMIFLLDLLLCTYLYYLCLREITNFSAEGNLYVQVFIRTIFYKCMLPAKWL